MSTCSPSKPPRPGPPAYTPIQLPNVIEGDTHGPRPGPPAYTPIQLPNVIEGGELPPKPAPPSTGQREKKG